MLGAFPFIPSQILRVEGCCLYFLATSVAVEYR